MSYLVDTNVLLRRVQSSHPMHSDAARSLSLLILRGELVSVIPQNFIEFWAVATRPLANNGLALSITDTAGHIDEFQQTFTLLPDAPEIFIEWQRLVALHAVSGLQAHDARLVAAMRVHGVTHLLTFNGADFKRYNEITVVNPQNIS